MYVPSALTPKACEVGPPKVPRSCMPVPASHREGVILPTGRLGGSDYNSTVRTDVRHLDRGSSKIAQVFHHALSSYRCSERGDGQDHRTTGAVESGRRRK